MSNIELNGKTYELKEVEAKAEDKSVEQMAQEIVEKQKAKIAEQVASEVMRADKASKGSVAKAEALAEGANDLGKIEVKEHEQVVYTAKNTRGNHRAGDQKKISKSVGLGLNKWFSSFVKRDYAGMEAQSKQLNYMTKLSSMSELSASAGANLIPTVLADMIYYVREDVGKIRPLATYIDLTGTSTNQWDMPNVATKPLVSWTSETAAKSTTTVTFGKQSLTPYVVAATHAFSKQIQSDAPYNITQLLANMFGEAIAKEEDKVFMTGNGSGRPTGIDTYTSAYAIINASGTLAFNHINSAYVRLRNEYRSNAVWVMSTTALEAVHNLKDSQNRPLLFDNPYTPGVQTLKGRPIVENNDIASTKIFLVDFSRYYLAEKWGFNIELDPSATLGGVSMFETNQIAVRAEERIDAELADTYAFTEINNVG